MHVRLDFYAALFFLHLFKCCFIFQHPFLLLCYVEYFISFWLIQAPFSVLVGVYSVVLSIILFLLWLITCTSVEHYQLTCFFFLFLYVCSSQRVSSTFTYYVIFYMTHYLRLPWDIRAASIFSPLFCIFFYWSRFVITPELCNVM